MTRVTLVGVRRSPSEVMFPPCAFWEQESSVRLGGKCFDQLTPLAGP